jgi:N-acetylneuraminic acid mutarotase
VNRKIQAISASTLFLCFVLLVFSISVVSAAEDFWISLEPLPTARSDLGVAVVDGKIYAMGGIINSRYTHVNEMYDPETDTWITRASMPTPRAGFGIAVFRNKIFVFGGSGYNNNELPGLIETTEVYDPVSDTWETRTPIPTPRENVCANIVDDKIYLIGGNTFSGPSWPLLSNQNEVYDPETDSWSTRTPIPNYVNYAFADLTSTVVDGKIFVMSGIINQMQSMDPTDPFNKIYDPETDTWSSGTMMPTLVAGLIAGATSGEFAPKRIHVLAGDTHQIYDPESDTWTVGTPMLTSRSNLGVAVIDDTLYAIGGNSANEQYIPAGYIPEFPSWTSMLFLFAALAVAVTIYKRKLPKNQSADK